VSSLADLITERLQPALAALLTAFDYAADSGADRWEFAVEMTELLAAGAALADLRWLILRNFAEHAKETTAPGDPRRSFRPLAPTSFPSDACLWLTLVGATTLRPFVARCLPSPSSSARREPVERTAKGEPAVSLPNEGVRRRNVPGRATGAITDARRDVTRAVTIFIEKIAKHAERRPTARRDLPTSLARWHPLITTERNGYG
jgi:hypothetical protein